MDLDALVDDAVLSINATSQLARGPIFPALWHRLECVRARGVPSAAATQWHWL